MDLKEPGPLEILGAATHVILEDMLKPPLEFMRAPISVGIEATHDILLEAIDPNEILKEIYTEELCITLGLLPRATVALRRVQTADELPYDLLLETVCSVAEIELRYRAINRSGDDVQQEMEIIDAALDMSKEGVENFFAAVPIERVSTAQQLFRSRVAE